MRCAFSGDDPLDASDQGGAERAERAADVGERRPARGDRVLAEPVRRPVGHQRAARQARREAHHRGAEARKVQLRRRLPEAFRTDQGAEVVVRSLN